MSEEYLTVSQAAARLGISERQARRYAGRLAPDDRREAGHMTGALVSLAAMQIEREKATGRAKTDTTPDALTHEAGHTPDVRPDTTPDAQSGEVLSLLKSENAFLRGLVQEHQRSEAELRTSLREALKAMPKALPDGEKLNEVGREKLQQVATDLGQVRTENESREDAPQAPIIPPGDQTPAAQKQVAQRSAKPRKLKPWQKVIMRIIGAR